MSSQTANIAQQLALATAAFISMPSAVQAQSPCEALSSGRLPKRVRVKRVGPWSLRVEKDGTFPAGHITTNFWATSSEAPSVRVAAEVLDVRTGQRVRCNEARLRTHEGTSLRVDLDDESLPSGKESPLVGVRIIVVHDPLSGVRPKTPLPQVQGTTQVSNVLYNNENITAWK